MYGGEEFAAEVARSLAEVERAFEAASPAQRVRAARAYLSACVYERSSLTRHTEHCVSLPGTALDGWCCVS